MTMNSSQLARALLIGAVLTTAGFSEAGALQKASVGLNLNTNAVSRSYVAAQIRSQARKKGIRLSSREVNTAAHGAINRLRAKGRGPQKGIIHLKFKRFTICIAWGKDKGHCS